jgi:hypothetical protein
MNLFTEDQFLSCLLATEVKGIPGDWSDTEGRCLICAFADKVLLLGFEGRREFCASYVGWLTKLEKEHDRYHAKSARQMD